MSSGIVIDKTKFVSYQREFAETNCIFIQDFLSQKVLDNLLKKITTKDFLTKIELDGVEKFGNVLALPSHHIAVMILNMMLNDNNLLSILQEITDCEKINDFVGRVHRSNIKELHEIGWHGDNSDNRLLAITLCLGTTVYTGAEFQLRKKQTAINLRQFGQLNAGEAIIFKISPELEHRLAPLQSGQRTVGVGWFRGN